MLSLIGDALENYVFEATAELPQPELFERLVAETYATMSMPQMQVGRVEGQLLRQLVALSRARCIVELGTFTGYSTLAMASALPADGVIHTCDVDPIATAVARRYFDESPWGDRMHIHLGPGVETLARFRAEGLKVDMAFIDADKGGYRAYYDALIEMMDPGALIVADNVLWSGKVLSPVEPSDHALVEFAAHVRADPRSEQVLLSVRDGALLIRKR